MEIALLDKGGLAVQVPIREICRQGTLAPGESRVHFRATELAIDPYTHAVHVEHRCVLSARGKIGGNAPKPAVEIFELGGPARRNRNLGARAERLTGAHSQLFGLIGSAGERLQDAGSRIGKTASGVDQPVIGGIADATAQRTDIVGLFDELLGVGDEGRTLVIPSKKIRKRDVSFDAEQKVRPRHKIISELRTGIAASKRIA